MVPHQIDQPQPTKQKSTQKNCATATMMLMIKDPILARALSNCENRGIPTHKQNSPDSRVPKPGKMTLQNAQNHARYSGNTGMAPFIFEVYSTRSLCSLRRVSSLVGGALILCLRASEPRRGFLRQQRNISQNRLQQLILVLSSVAVVVDGATDDPSRTAASDAFTPSSGSRSRQATLGSVLVTAARLRLQGIQKQHFLSSVSSPVMGSTLFTERQQKIFLIQRPHLLCCFDRSIGTD